MGPGDEVITTTHTFTASAEVARYLGADVKLVDIDPATYCISPAALEAAIKVLKTPGPHHGPAIAQATEALAALALLDFASVGNTLA